MMLGSFSLLHVFIKMTILLLKILAALWWLIIVVSIALGWVTIDVCLVTCYQGQFSWPFLYRETK